MILGWGEKRPCSRRGNPSRAFLLGLFLCSLVCAAHGSPWIDAGDARARHHLQYLNDRGVISLSLSTWPLPWAEVERALSHVALLSLDASETWSYRYLRHERDIAQRTLKTTKTLYASNSLRPYAGFADETRNQLSAASDTRLTGEHFAAGLHANYVHDPIDGDQQHFDGSFLAATYGNWIAGIGAIDRWWGPGWHSSLILSTHARPAPGIFVQRKEATASTLPLLQLAGAWDIHLFASVLHQDDLNHDAQFVGGRVSFRPLQHLELGYSQTLISDGEIPRAAAPSDDPEAPADSEIEPARLRLISYDARISASWNSATFGLYGQYLNEKDDSNGYRDSTYLLGLDSGFSFFSLHTRVGMEISDSDSVTADTTEQLGFPSGYQYRLRSIGESSGVKGKKLAFFSEFFFENGCQLRVRGVKVSADANAGESGMYQLAIPEQQLLESEFSIPVAEKVLASIGVFTLKEKMTFADETLSSGAFTKLTIRF